MKRFFLILAVASSLALMASASEDCRDLDALDALYGVRELVIRDAPSYSVNREIDDKIEMLREPLADGGFRWVQLVRPSDGTGPYDKEGHFVRSSSPDSADVFESEASNAWAVAIVVPRKRSFFRSNNESWIGDVAITCSIDGRSETQRESIDRWMRPDTTHTIDLGMIADRCRVRVETVTKEEYLDKEALVEIHIRQAVEEDNPENPNFETIRILKRIRYSASPETLDYEIGKLERQLFPNLHSYPFTTLLRETREAHALLSSESEEDRDKGAKMLESVVDEIGKK